MNTTKDAFLQHISGTFEVPALMMPLRLLSVKNEREA
jgi:hypothetical protein